MVRMANVYLNEGSLENAYILYMKFMTLFVEKIRAHPEYASVSPQVKATNQAKLKEVMPKAEKLKQKLLEQYTKEYKKYLEDKVLHKDIYINYTQPDFLFFFCRWFFYDYLKTADVTKF